MSLERVKASAAPIGTTNPRHADEWQETACGARDIAAAFSELEVADGSIHKGPMRPAHAVAQLQMILIRV